VQQKVGKIEKTSTYSSVVVLGLGRRKVLGEAERALLVGGGARHGVEEDVVLKVGRVRSVILEDYHVALGEELKKWKASEEDQFQPFGEEKKQLKLTSLNLT